MFVHIVPEMLFYYVMCSGKYITLYIIYNTLYSTRTNATVLFKAGEHDKRSNATYYTQN